VISAASALIPRTVLKAAVAVAASAGIACTAAPAAERTHTIAPGVTVLGARVGGLTAAPAERRVERAVARPIRIVYRGETFEITPQKLGLKAGVERAVRAALAATPRSRIGVPVKFDDGAVDAYVDALAKQFGRKARNAEVIGADASGPVFRGGQLGLAVERKTMRAAIAQQLSSGSRAPLALMMSAVRPDRTPGTFGPVVVIDRGANTLKLYRANRLVKTFRVATGTAYYPTPSGVFEVVNMQANPWWTPPNSDWARGLSPVPPGPGNPLGTRWMGIDSPGVGMHGTPDDASIGYSRSHGCIRMHIPDAEWLFEHVEVGTPVVIL
jgi:lipoprotein-anchoring transpeptidase ErfK/SrfK